MLEHFDGNPDNIYPRLLIDPKKITYNISHVLGYLKEEQTLTLVTKVVRGQYELVKAVFEECKKQKLELRDIAE